LTGPKQWALNGGVPVLLLVSHEVKNYTAWKQRFDANRPMREAAGMTEHFVGRDIKRPNVAHVGLLAPSLEAVDRYLAQPELIDAMEAAGVAKAPEIRLVSVT
jgi:hypothetical protein